jgi:hypothetical protein
MFITFFIPIAGTFIAHIFTQSPWFQSLHPAIKIMIILALCPFFFVAKQLQILEAESSLTYKIFLGTLMGLSISYWIKKSGLNQKDCSKK